MIYLIILLIIIIVIFLLSGERFINKDKLYIEEKINNSIPYNNIG